MHEYTKYFKEHIGYDRFFQAIYQKYQSLGNFTGTIKLTNLDKYEAYEFSRTFGKTYQEHDTFQITIKKFLKLMAQTKYTDFDLATLIKEYFNLDLKTNKEIMFEKNNREQLLYLDLINTYPGKGAIWLQNSITNKNNSYALIHKRYLKNAQALKKELINILSLLNNLPSQKILLPIYAAKYTQNPHYLDLDSNHFTLFLNALADLEVIKYPISREEKINLLYQNNILIDNFSNFVITYNLIADKDYLNAFAQNKEVLILNIQNIINVKHFKGQNQKIFILENPSLLSEIIASNINASIIIASGFTNIAVYLLLDKLVASGNTLYYNGDFDPEGLLIASKLKAKYQENLILFGYDKKDYQNCNAQNNISDKRLSLLNKVSNNELKEIKSLLREYKKAGYQENNTINIIAYIDKNK